VKVFTVDPLPDRSSADDPREYDDSQIDKDFNVRIGEGDPHELRPPS
jgi:hypothetical protein